jgi:hypothetical protein
MPVSPAFAESNRVQTERLRELVGRLDAGMLAVRLPNGWTVALALAHIAFWDRQRLCLMRRWAADNWCAGGYDGELFNEVLRPFLELIPSSRAAEIALQVAEEVDAFLLTVPDAVVEAALARPDRPNLDRGSHREGHLDQIEEALAGRAGRARWPAPLVILHATSGARYPVDYAGCRGVHSPKSGRRTTSGSAAAPETISWAPGYIRHGDPPEIFRL